MIEQRTYTFMRQRGDELGTRDESTAAKGQSEGGTSTTGEACGSILIIDDDVLVSATLCDMLAVLGYEAGAVDNVDSFKRKLNTSIALVIVDWDFKGNISGLELLAFVKKHFPTIKRVLLTGHDRPVGFEDNADQSYLAKPLGLATVRSFLQKYLPEHDEPFKPHTRNQNR